MASDIGAALAESFAGAQARDAASQIPLMPVGEAPDMGRPHFETTLTRLLSTNGLFSP